MNNAQDYQPRNGENKNGFPPKRKIVDWIIFSLFIALILLGVFFFTFGSNRKSSEGTKSDILTEQKVEDSSQSSNNSSIVDEAIHQAENLVQKGSDEIEKIDRQSIWNTILPHNGGTSDLALTTAFIVIILVMVGSFLPAKIMRFITLAALVACIIVSVVVVYPQIDTNVDNLVNGVLFAIAPLLLAMVICTSVYLYGRSYSKNGYRFFERIGFLISLILSLVANWIFAYGYLYHHGLSEDSMPKVYPIKILQLGENAYIYITAGIIFFMLFIGGILKAGKQAGNLGKFISLLFLGHLLYETFSGDNYLQARYQTPFPIGVMIGMIILSIIFKEYGKKQYSN